MEKSLQKKKKTNRRALTKNEKFLLSLLALVILLWLFFRFLLSPQWEKMNALEAERLDYQNQISEINQVLKTESQINMEWDSLHREKEEIVSRYFPKMDQAQLIYLLNSLLHHDSVEVSDLNFDRPAYEDVAGVQVKNMSVSLPYGGRYEGIVDILNALKHSPRKILIESLTMDKTDSNDLAGNMSLKVYSLDGIADGKSDIIHIEKPEDVAKATPFAPFTEYEEARAAEEAKKRQEVERQEELAQINPYVEETLLDFETKNTYFLPSQELVKGDVSLSTMAKSKKHSLRFEYNIMAVEDVNRAYIDVSRNNIQLKYPPNTIGLWIYSYDYSPSTLGVLFNGQMGEEILVPLVEGMGWTGWRYVETTPPTDLSLYPLKLDKLYLEIPEGRDDYGVILMDKLEAVYSRNIGEDGKDNSLGDYIFHVVERGDTVEKISQAYYGTISYKNEIFKLNDMKAGDILPMGKVLVLKKR